MYQSVLRLKDGTELTGGSPGSAVKSLTLHTAVNAGQEFTIGSAGFQPEGQVEQMRSSRLQKKP